MSGYNNLGPKLEAAWHGYLTSVFTGRLSIYKLGDSIGTDLPDERIDISCPRSRPFTDALDASSAATNRIISCELRIRTRADVQRNDAGTEIGSARERHDENVGAIMDALYVDGLPALINAVGIASINVDQCDWPVEETTVDGVGYITTITFDVMANSIA